MPLQRIEVTDENLDELVERYADVYLSSKSIAELFGIHRNNLSRWASEPFGEIRKKPVPKEGPRGTWILYNVGDALIARATKRKQKPFLRKKVNGVMVYRCNGPCGEWKERDGFYANPSPRSAEHGLLTKCKLCYNEYGRRQTRENPDSVEKKRVARRERTRRLAANAKANKEYREIKEVSATIFVWYLDRYTTGSPESVEADTGIDARSIRRIRKNASEGRKVEVAMIDRLLTGIGRADLMAKFAHGLDRNRPPWHHKYACCQKCWRTTRVYMAKGLCATCYRHRNDPDYVPLADNGGWSQRHACCVVCGKTDSRHAAHGQCHRCHQRLRKQRRKAAAEVGSGHGIPRQPSPPT